ncbi:peptidase, M23 family [Peptoniphilus sp. oral taxon 386 str. F0131]|nr:peptidase, M23 family [Peptoniphilus sp. oral taxon 386 str. F0131]
MFASSSTQLQKQKQKVEKKKEDATKKMEKTKDKLKNKQEDVDTVQAQISALDRKIDGLTSNINQLENKINSLNSEIIKNQELLDKTIKDLEEKQKLFGQRVRAMYMNGNVNYIEVILNSRSMEDLIRNNEIITSIANYDKKLVDYISEQAELIKKTRAKLESDRNEVTLSKAKLEQEKVGFVAANNEKQSYMNVLQKDLEAYRKEYEKAQENWSKLDGEIVRLQKEIAAAKKREEDIAKTGNINIKIRPGAKVGWPVPGHNSISSPYGMRFHPILKISRFHSGVDIPAPNGTPVVAARAGTVIMARAMSGYGNVVMVDHGDIVTVYAHNSSIKVKVGQSVSQGDIVALVGSTGLSTGPHLHFEVRINGQTVDPMGYL